MVCIYCGGGTAVINSRPQRRANQIWRRRRCKACGSVFTSEESAQYGSAWQVRSLQGRLEPFSRLKLCLSLLKSCEHRLTALNDAEALTATVIAKLPPHVRGGTLDARDIARAAQVALNRFDKTASIHYQAFHKD